MSNSNLKINEKAVAFVSDWRKRTEKQRKKYVRLFTGALIFAFVSCIVSFFWFQNKNYRRIVSQNMKYVEDSAVQEANQIEREMEHAEMLIINLANQYATLDSFYADTSVEEKLALLSDKTLFDRIAYIAPDGIDTSLEGVAFVADREYFRDAMEGNSGWQMIRASRVTGQPTVVFYAPIRKKGEIVGVMAGFYEQGRLDDLFSYQLFDFTPNTYLLFGDGTTVANSNDEEVVGNMLTELSKKTFVGGMGYEQILQAIADERRTTITFSFVDHHETSVGVIVEFNDSDWMILSILPDNITADMVSNANRAGTVLLVVIILVFLLLLVVLFRYIRKQKERMEYEMSNASDNLEANMRAEQRQISIIESLVDVYSGVYYIDLERGEYQRIKENEVSAFSIPDTGPSEKGFSDYVEQFVDASDKPELREFFEVRTLQLRLEEYGTLSVEYQRTDGGWRRAILTPAGRNAEGRIIAAVFAVQKTDREKRIELQTKKALQEAYEAAQMANNAKTTFLSNMSHDIRTPMNAIVGMTAIAAANLDHPDKVSDCLKKITSSSKHLLGLINEVLDMSKIESGKVDLCEEEFSLSDLIDNLISIHQALIREKNHSLIVKVNNLKHERVIGDSTRLKQVFANLLSNAIKYTPDGGKIEISISEKETNKSTVGWYEVVFQDNGIGMSEEFLRNLFEPFTRAKDNRITQIQGTGLGMPIAKNIIRMMNGDITVESRINQGSTFTVSFVLKIQTEEDVDCKRFVDLPVLVVDDDVTACESTCMILDGLSMDSEWVTSGREAVEKTVERHERAEDYYAVIVDWKMPDMNGIETTREIRRRVGSDIPIIVISAFDWTDIEQEARAAGVNAFLSKPLFKSRVVSLFSELVGGKREKETVGRPEDLRQYDFSGRRLLLVEDNELNREIAVELLAMAGLETETAEDGKAGIEKFANAQPGYYDLILMDIQMPVMNGYDATRAIRALAHPDAKKIPIIAMTANAFASDVRAAYNAGMNGHISKPIDINHVVQVLNEMFHG